MSDGFLSSIDREESRSGVASVTTDDIAMTVEAVPIAAASAGGSGEGGNDPASIQRTRRFYCTTSSVYAENTISNPNHGQISYW